MTRTTTEPYDRRLADLASAMEKSRRARAWARESCAAAAATRVRVRETKARALDRATASIDREHHPDPAMARRLERLSEELGRSTEIQKAKERLVDQYGISHGEAFEILARLSNTSNRKVRDVAAQLLNLGDSRLPGESEAGKPAQDTVRVPVRWSH
jgi:hypothetical protein